MKFTTIVIIRASDKTLAEIRKKLPEKGKAYATDWMIQTASLIPGTDMNDKQSVARALAELGGKEAGVDEKGIYLMTTLFKDNLIADCVKKIDKNVKQLSICDEYDVFDLDMTDNLLSYIPGYDRFPHAIITPDVSLIRSEEEMEDWKNKFMEILKKNENNSFALVLDCHV